jgi:hypothetical protein
MAGDTRPFGWAESGGVRHERVEWGLIARQQGGWRRNDYWMFGGQSKEYGQCDMVERKKRRSSIDPLGDKRRRYRAKETRRVEWPEALPKIASD